MESGQRSAAAFSKGFVKGFLLVLFGLAVLAGLGYLFWTTTPLYAFQEADQAAKNHDLAEFRERVDVREFVESLLNDLLVFPAKTTPDLSGMQREVARGAINMEATRMEADLINGIETSVGGRTRQPNVSYWGEQPAAAGELIAADDFGDLVKVTAREVGGSVGRLKEVVYRRMQYYAQTHRDSTPGRLLSCPANERVLETKQILAEDGLTMQNFRGIASYDVTSDDTAESCKIGFKFFSPKVSHDVVLQVELRKGSMFSLWQIKRLSNISDFFMQLGEDYNSEMHALVSNSLYGINKESVNDEVRGLTDRIKQSQAAQNLLKRFNIK